MSKKISKLTQKETEELAEYRSGKGRSGTEAMRVLAIMLFDKGSS